MPSVVLPSEGGVESDVGGGCCWVAGRLVLEAARVASKSVGALGTEHIMTSRIGLGLETRLGQMTTVRLCASMRFADDHN